MMFDETVDLFAGAGGWDVAAQHLGVDPLGIELDDDACATRAAAGLSTLQADVAALDPLDFGGIRGLIASPPCQAWSRAGNRLGIVDQEHVFAVAQAMLAGVDLRSRTKPRLQDERSLLVVEPLRWALALRPAWVALEQVPDVLPFWQLIEGALGARGYSVWCGKVNSADYGVAQTRERAILLASLDRRVSRPQATHADPRPGLPLHVEPWVTMAEALGWGLSEAPAGTIVSVSPSGGPRSGALDGGSGSRERYRREQREGRWVFRNGNQPRAAVRGLDEPAPTIAFGSSRIEEGVDPNAEPAPTVTSRVDRWQGVGGWGYERPATTVQGDPRIAQPGHKRESKDPDAPGRMEDAVRVTLEEAAILQSFPPDYPWAGRTKTSRFMQVGNAVPPLLALRMLEAVA